MIIMDNRRLFYSRTDGKSICTGCKYMNAYTGCMIKANDTTEKYPMSCDKYNGLLPYKIEDCMETIEYVSKYVSGMGLSGVEDDCKSSLVNAWSVIKSIQDENK